MSSLNTTGGLNSTVGSNATASFNATNGLNTTAISPVTSTRDGLPLHPRLTPAFGIAGALLILTGLAYACASIKIMRLYMFLSGAYLTSISVTVLIVYVMSAPDGNVSNGVQGGYLVGIVLPSIILGGIFQQYVPWLAKRSGCVVGGFCMAMWIEVLCPGGLITSSPMLGLFIALMCLAALAPTFHTALTPTFLTKAKEPAYMVCSAFSGITAVVLGIDCYSRAGLKEFWVYTWDFHRVRLFGFPTTSYPLTRGIKAELGMIPVLFALALVFQGKFFKHVKARKERKAAAVAQEKEKHENDELEVGRNLQEGIVEERAAWEERYREPEKKKPYVEQRQVDPPSPAKTGHKFHSTASFVPDKMKRDNGAAAIADPEHQDDDIMPVEAPRESAGAVTDDLQTQRPQSPRRYPSLKPASYPPPPRVPQADYQCDMSSDGRVSPVSLASDMEDHERHVVPDQDDAEKSSIQLSIQHGDEEDIPAVTKLSQQDLSEWEQHITQQPIDENEATEQHLAPSDQEDTDEPLQYAHHGPTRMALREVTNDPSNDEPSQHSSKLAAVKREEIDDRTREWRKTLDQADRNPRPSSIRSDDANNDPSVWSGFEGTHTTEDTSEQLESQEISTPQPLQHSLSRTGALKQNKRRSRRVSATEGKTAVLPTPVKSARVKKRNSSLPMLDTGSTLLDNRTTIATQRKNQLSLTNNFVSDETQGVVARRNFGSHGRFVDGNSNVESTEFDEITLSQARATIHARSVSYSQVSSTSSYRHGAQSSVGCQSPVNTTARTTPVATSPVQDYPPFMMVALPLGKPYPMPPCETFQLTRPPFRHSSAAFNPNDVFTLSGVNDPNTVMQNSNLWTPSTPRRSSVPFQSAHPAVPFPVTQSTTPFPAGQPTLIHRMGFDENLRSQNKENLRNTQRRGTGEAVENQRRLDARRRTSVQAETAMRSGHLDDPHKAALRKMQRQAERNCQ